MQSGHHRTRDERGSHRRRWIAAATAVATIGAGGGLLAISAQAYGPTSSTLPGSVFITNNTSATSGINNTFTDTLTLTATPATPGIGDTVTVTLSGATGPLTGPVPVQANTQVVRGTVELSGAQTGDVALASGASCNYPVTPIAANTAEGPWTTTGTFVASSTDVTTIALKQIVFDDKGNGEGGADGNTGNLCAGSSQFTNADYYISPGVTQTVGSGQPSLAKTAPVASATILTTVGEEGEPTDTGTPTVEPTDTGTPTVEPTDTGTPTVEPTDTGTPTVEPTGGVTVTATVTETVTETATATATVTETVTATVTAEPTGKPCRDHPKKHFRWCGHGHGHDHGNGHGWGWAWGHDKWGDGPGNGHGNSHGNGQGRDGYRFASSTAGVGSAAGIALISLALLGSMLYVRKTQPVGKHR